MKVFMSKKSNIYDLEHSILLSLRVTKLLEIAQPYGKLCLFLL